MDNCDRLKMKHLISNDWCLFPQNWPQCFKVEMFSCLDYQEKIWKQ